MEDTPGFTWFYQRFDENIEYILYINYTWVWIKGLGTNETRKQT